MEEGVEDRNVLPAHSTGEQGTAVYVGPDEVQEWGGRGSECADGGGG